MYDCLMLPEGSPNHATLFPSLAWASIFKVLRLKLPFHSIPFCMNNHEVPPLAPLSCLAVPDLTTELAARRADGFGAVSRDELSEMALFHCFGTICGPGAQRP